MKTSIVTILLTFFIYSGNNTNDDNIQTVDTLKYLDTPVELKSKPIIMADTVKPLIIKRAIVIIPKVVNAEWMLISSGQMSPYISLKIDGYDFDLVTEGKDTIYLSTTDTNFQTPEGYKVGTKLSDLPQDFQEILTKEPGWAYYLKLPSGWTLSFCEGSSCTDYYPIANSKVKWIFKRR